MKVGIWQILGLAEDNAAGAANFVRGISPRNAKGNERMKWRGLFAVFCD